MKFKLIALCVLIFFIKTSKAQNVGIGTTLPQARLHVADSSVFFSSPNNFPANSGVSPVENAGIGMLWIAGKAALRVGRETSNRWAYDNIGVYSSSFGYNNNVTSVGGFAAGADNTVNGNYSIGLGSYNYLRNQRSLAFGNYSRALGDYSNAIGYDVAAEAFQSTALGRYNTFSGNPTTDVLTDPLLLVGNGTSDINRSNALSIIKDGRIMVGSDSLTNYQLYVKAKNFPSAIFAQSNAAENYSTAIYAKNGSPEGNGVLGIVTGAGAGTVLAPTYKLNAIAGYGYGNATAVAASSAGGIAVDAQSLSGYAILSYGKLKFEKIGAGAGKLLVSDATGEATWQNPPKITLENSSATGLASMEWRTASTFRGGFGYDGSASRFFFYDGESGTNTFFIKNGKLGIQRSPTTNDFEVNGNASKASAGSWLGNSDARLKKDIQPISGALQKIMMLNGITYQWADDKTGMKRPEGTQMGFTAQNIKEVFPNEVSTDAQGFLQTAYGTYDALIVEAIRELKNENDLLKKEIAEIKKMLQKK